jgi:hypothetical protein
MREMCFILVRDQVLRVYFGLSTRIPDSRERWQLIWDNRAEITEIAHSHPGDLLDFSQEDLTTMEAVEAGIGRKLIWSIITKDGFLSRSDGKDSRRQDSPWWLELMRALSYGELNTRKTRRKRKEHL